MAGPLYRATERDDTLHLDRRLVRRSAQLLVGLFLYGVGIAFLVRGELGAASWDVLTLGITQRVPLTFGAISVIVSFVVLLLWIPLRQKPGVGTIANAVLVGLFVDIGFIAIPESNQFWLQVAYMLTGIVVIGCATGLYIGSRLGPGPRDGLMTGLHRITGQPIWLVRTVLEGTVLSLGWLLGGTVGIGTVAFALMIGPICQYFMRIFYVSLPSDASSDDAAGAVGASLDPTHDMLPAEHPAT